VKIPRRYFVAFAVLLSGLSTAAAQSYTVLDLGTLGGTTSQAFAVSSNGLIAGTSLIADDDAQHAFY
jgi:uncharacterized membrane protein